MPIIRSELSFDNHFTQIPNAWLRDERLSLKAIGLLAQLMSHSVGWNVSIRSLAAANKCGLDLIRSAVAELEEAGYLKRDQKRAEAGRFAEMVWYTSEPSPVLGFPTTVNPMPENPTTKNTNLKEDNLEELNARQAERERLKEAFDEFWAIYPRKAGKQAALKAFEKAYAALGDFETIILGAKRYRDDPNRHAAYTAHAATWLNAGRWDDEPLPERVKTKEEIAEEIRAKNEAQRLAALEESRRVAEESQRLRQELQENPVKRCEHDRIIYACLKCSKDFLANREDERSQ